MYKGDKPTAGSQAVRLVRVQREMSVLVGEMSKVWRMR